MQKVIAFGAGLNFNAWYELFEFSKEFEFVGLVDNDPNKQGTIIKGLKVDKPETITMRNDFDKILYFPFIDKPQILSQLLEMGVQFEKIDFLCGFYERGFVIPNKYYLDNKLIFEHNGIKLFVETEGDCALFSEVIVFEIYRIISREKHIVLDVGGCVADSALYFASLPNVEKVHSYEPFVTNYNRGLENLKLNPHLLSKIEFNHFAIEDRERTFCSSNKEGIGCNIIEEDLLKLEEITVKDVSKIFAPIYSQKGDAKILLKLDCEGSEFPIIDKMSECGLLKNTAAITMEVHLPGFAKIEKFEKLQKQLLDNGFAFHFTSHPTHINLIAFNINGEK
ncbi:hypothetical protein AGMMS49938_18180 [Fibrobacterales bacterium]|nr:hypothetical protein AGMMS49938_18180 [Fibrobacterales bacterium]